MRVRILRIADDYELNIRYTDEIAEDEGMTDAQLAQFDDAMKRVGRYYLDAERVCFPARTS